jgi:deoxyribodipyrimidine photo-lyase
MRREFQSREELTAYLASEFPEAAGRSHSVSPICGGVEPAEAALSQSQPKAYAFSRNHLDGAVTRLSPYIRHGVLSLARVRDHAFAAAGHPHQVSKFVTELAWRDYWQRLYFLLGDGIWRDREEYKTGWPASSYAEDLPEDIQRASTGLACMDAFVAELTATGYLHNHARMWFAAYVVHWRRVRWQAGAFFFLQHLLDGDPASNNLSWQWVASTFSSKAYLFNRENLEKYGAGRFCRVCPAVAACPFDAGYPELSARLFRIGGAQ